MELKAKIPKIEADILHLDALIEEVQFTPEEFQSAIYYYITEANFLDDKEFWDHVIRHASRGRLGGMPWSQYKYLLAWLKPNWFWFTQGWSLRTKIEFRRKLTLLEVNNYLPNQGVDTP